MIGICPATETVLFTFAEGRGTFYNLANNMFSSQVRLSSVICTEVPGRWYFMEYDQDAASIRLRDIANEVDALLQWKELFIPANMKSVEEQVAYAPLLKLRDGEDIIRELCSVEAERERGPKSRF